jgi:hypothetical protein
LLKRIPSYSNTGERSDDENAIPLEFDEGFDDDDHQPVIDNIPEVQSDVTNEATSMTDTQGVMGEPFSRDPYLVFNNSGTHDANKGSNMGNNQESKEEPAPVMYITNPFAPPKPEYERSKEGKIKDEKYSRIEKLYCLMMNRMTSLGCGKRDLTTMES